MPDDDQKVRASCAACGKAFLVNAALAGRRVRCKCGVALTVPAPAIVPGAAEDESPPDFDALAEPDLAPPAYAPPPLTRPRKLPRPKGAPSDPRPTATGPGGASRWAKGTWDALTSRDPGPRSREQHVMQWLIFGPGFIAAGVVFILFCMRAADGNAAFMRRAKPADAIVIGKAAVSHSGRGAAQLLDSSTTYKFEVAFRLGDHDQRAPVSLRGDKLPTGFDASPAPDWTGKRIDILYDPENPAHAETAIAATAKDWTWAYAIGGAFAAIGLWGTLTRFPFGSSGR